MSQNKEQKNKKVMSIAISPDLQEELKRYAKRKVVSVSTYVGDLIEKAIQLNVDHDPFIVGKSPEDPDPIVVQRAADEDILPVVLKIPKKLIGTDALAGWLEAQTKGILSQLSK